MAKLTKAQKELAYAAFRSLNDWKTLSDPGQPHRLKVTLDGNDYTDLFHSDLMHTRDKIRELVGDDA